METQNLNLCVDLSEPSLQKKTSRFAEPDSVRNMSEDYVSNPDDAMDQKVVVKLQQKNNALVDVKDETGTEINVVLNEIEESEELRNESVKESEDESRTNLDVQNSSEDHLMSLDGAMNENMNQSHQSQQHYSDLVSVKDEIEYEDDSFRNETQEIRELREALQEKSEDDYELGKSLEDQNSSRDYPRNPDGVEKILFEELQQQKDDLLHIIEEMKTERDSLRIKIQELGKSRDELLKKSDDDSRDILEVQNKLNVSQEKINGFLDSSDSLRSIKERLLCALEKMGKEHSPNYPHLESVSEEAFDLNNVVEEDESTRFLLNVKYVSDLAKKTEEGFVKYEEMRRKEKRELENSLASLTEENRDVHSLLRIALVEKEAGEKAINRMKGNGEQKRAALLQIAERGLQRVGFGFMRSTTPIEEPVDNSGSKSDSSECEEEVVSLASTVEKIMKNLRIEITQLRRSLEDSRSDTEQLQNLTEKQAQQLTESKMYIEELEERESMLRDNIEQLMVELAGAEEEIIRWREACELEVDAGKSLIEERDRVEMILREELDKVQSELDMLKSKLKLKEKLAAAAMFAQEASEKSLRLADRKASELRQRIEELTRQLEEADGRGERNQRRKIRHLCWPWRALRVNPSNNSSTTTRRRNVRRMLPEMEAFLLNSSV